jgi:cytochrome c-type biogenesis protein CcmH
VNPVDWFPAVAVVAAGLVAGAIVWWRAQKAPLHPRSEAPLPLRDLEGKRDALLAQLRELDFAGEKRTPDQIAGDRHRLEHQAARVLREIDALAHTGVAAPRKAAKTPVAVEPPLPQPAPATGSSLRGFFWGIGSAAALGVLFYFVSQSAKERQEGGSLTGNTPRETAAPEATGASDAELQAAEAALARNPDDIEARLALVRQHLMRQDMMAVFKETQTVLKRSPGEPRALSYQSLVRLAMGQPEQAESMLKEALAKDPQLLDAYIHLMLVYTRTNRAADADRVLADASKRFPPRASALKDLLGEMRQQGATEATADAGAAAADPHVGVPVGGPAAGPATGPAASAPASGEKKVSGVLELDASLSGQTFQGAIVFVTLREGGFGAGPPLAARRIPAAAFPMAFEIGSRDSMSGEPLPDDLLIEARIDSDGDPITRPPSDPYGRADRVAAGSTGVNILLKRKAP